MRVEMLKSRKIARSGSRGVSTALCFCPTNPLPRCIFPHVLSTCRQICFPLQPDWFANTLSLTKQAKVIRSSLAFHLRPDDDLSRALSFDLTTSIVSSFRRATITTSPHLGLAKVIRSPRRMTFAALTKLHRNRCKFPRPLSQRLAILLAHNDPARCRLGHSRLTIQYPLTTG